MSLAEDWIDPNSSEDSDIQEDAELEYTADNPEKEQRGVFSLEKVQLQFPVSIRCLAVENNILVMALTSDKLMIVDLERPEDIIGKHILNQFSLFLLTFVRY